jgi:thymidylate kinase
MIIVTGCDNSGKTTLVKHINEKFGIPIADRFSPLPPRTPSDWQKWYQWVLDNIERKEQVVYDRFLIDEFVYGPILRGSYNISFLQIAQLADALIMKQPLYIYTCPSPEYILSTYEDRKQYVDKDLIFEVLDQFNRVNKSWPINQLRNFTRFNYVGDPKKEIIDAEIETYLRKGRLH